MEPNWHHEKPCTDHFGNKYPTIKALAAAYSLSPACLSRRLNIYHWSLEKALTTPSKSNGGVACYDHKGIRYKSFSLMCKAYNQQRKTVKYRITHGWSLEQALTTQPK